MLQQYNFARLSFEQIELDMQVEGEKHKRLGFKFLKKQFLKCTLSECTELVQTFFWNVPKNKSTINNQIQNDSTGQSFRTI